MDAARLPESEEERIAVIVSKLKDHSLKFPPFAPPFLIDEDIVVAQAANILNYLAPRIGLAPEEEDDRIFAHQIQLTVTDFLMEVHDTHHPISNMLHYEEQKDEAKLRAKGFIKDRIHKHMSYYEQILNNNRTGSGWLIGDQLSYPDLSVFQIVEGLRYAFPNAFKNLEHHYTKVIDLRNAVAVRPNIMTYLQSDRRIPFNTHGVFRYYPELDS